MNNFRIYIFLLLIVLFLPLSVNAQYVRRNEFYTEKQRRMQYELDDWVSYLRINNINSIAVGNEYIYFATLDGGIWRYRLYENYWDYPFTTSNGLPSNSVLEVIFDEKTNYLWAITDIDVCIFLPAEQEWLCKSEADFWPYEQPESKIPQNNNDIEPNIFYTREYLKLLPHYFANGPWTIIDDWILMDENFEEYDITGFLRDNWERVWFIIEDLGVGIGSTTTQRMDVVPLGLSNIEPKVLEYQYNDIWIGGNARNGEGRPGIVKWLDQDGTWEYYQARWISYLPSDNVIDIAVNGDTVWFATDYGLSMLDTRKNRWKNYDESKALYSKDLTDLLINKKTLYIASNNGLNTLDLSTGIIKRIKDDNIALATIYQIAAQKDTIWVVSNRGIYRLRPEIGDWMLVTTTAAISDIPVTAIEVFGNEVWFTSPEGVFRYDSKTKKWESYPQLGMEITGPYFDIEVDDKSVWFTTPEGLLKYDRIRKYWKLFTTEDGLLSNNCYRLLLDGDYIWIANKKGITQFYWNNPRRID